jgi:primosomal protein N' (replication factor Y) (superfamily II helicase)
LCRQIRESSNKGYLFIFAAMPESTTSTLLFPENAHGQFGHTWIEVILPLALPKTYTYHVPPEFLSKVKAGCRVEVVFGKNKKYAGIIKTVQQEKPAYETKSILNIIDDEPVVYETQLKFWNWMSSYYMCSEGEVMSAALPAHLKLSSEAVLMFNEDYGDNFSNLNHEEYLVAEALLIKKELHLNEVQKIVDDSHVYPLIKRLIEKQVCYVYEALNEKYKIQKENFIILNPDLDNEEKLTELLNNWTRAPKQLELLLAYLHLSKTEGDVTQTALLKKSGASLAQLKGLIEKNVLLQEKRSTDRIRSLPKKVDIDFSLTDAQSSAFDQVMRGFEAKQACLLHGVTSSGKTLIYIKIIEKLIKLGKQVLYLLPEITLTAQIIRRLQKYFGGYIGIYHSKFSNNERVELWNKIKSGELKVILGARSALFLPFRDLGLVIVDEEHDPSFKQQDPAPRYNARDAAIYFASLVDAKILLGSATPSLESYYNATINKYTLVELEERYGGVQLPSIEIVDTRLVAASKKGKVMISPQLKAAIEKTVEGKKQVILFQNRRGYAPYLICGTCGHLPQCSNCDVTLTLHKYSNKLHCHYCGSTYPRLTNCPACGTVNWMEKNFGTEKIEEELENEFPDLRIARMDIDSVRGKNAHDTLIQLFEQHKLDILTGTQMVVKGLDFENVNLVGVLDADGLLSFTDFRVNERAFQLMEQVSGRAGRKDIQGRVLIQASRVSHPVLMFVKDHDYLRFFDFELDNRKRFAYPPFSKLIEITLKHQQKEVVDEAADTLARMLSKDLGDYIAGPAAPVVSRIRSMYIMEILVKLPKELKISQYKKVIGNYFNLLHADKKFRSVVLVADVDPV